MDRHAPLFFGHCSWWTNTVASRGLTEIGVFYPMYSQWALPTIYCVYSVMLWYIIEHICIYIYISWTDFIICWCVYVYIYMCINIYICRMCKYLTHALLKLDGVTAHPVQLRWKHICSCGGVYLWDRLSVRNKCQSASAAQPPYLLSSETDNRIFTSSKTEINRAPACGIDHLPFRCRCHHK